MTFDKSSFESTDTDSGHLQHDRREGCKQFDPSGQCGSVPSFPFLCILVNYVQPCTHSIYTQQILPSPTPNMEEKA